MQAVKKTIWVAENQGYDITKIVRIPFLYMYSLIINCRTLPNFAPTINSEHPKNIAVTRAPIRHNTEQAP